MEDQYGMADPRQYMYSRPHFTGDPQPENIFSGHRNLTETQTFCQMSEIGPCELHHEFCSDTTMTKVDNLDRLEMDGGDGFGGDDGNGRWPRQETLTLLEIRTKLDPMFKETNQKGPLWDEVSRLMSEEHGHQRSGKKCREKFENLYKYYKKTKEGKVGRQDGKNYRFFRQLEALYGETSNPIPTSKPHLHENNFRFHNSINTFKQPNQETPKLSESFMLTNSSELFDSSTSEEVVLMGNDLMEKNKKRRGRKNWRVKIRDFIDEQMRKVIEKQEACLEKMTASLEKKEEERVLREEEWRKQEVDRFDREHKLWASERAWIEARDAALMEALQSLSKDHNGNGSERIVDTLKGNDWSECESRRLIQLRTIIESRFEEGGCSEEVLWEEIASRMGCFGYDRSGLMCKEKWERINIYLRKTSACSKKHIENSMNCYFQNIEFPDNQGGAYGDINEQVKETTRLATNDSYFRLLMGDRENLWENYGVKLNKGENYDGGI